MTNRFLWVGSICLFATAVACGNDSGTSGGATGGVSGSGGRVGTGGQTGEPGTGGTVAGTGGTIAGTGGAAGGTGGHVAGGAGGNAAGTGGHAMGGVTGTGGHGTGGAAGTGGHGTGGATGTGGTAGTGGATGTGGSGSAYHACPTNGTTCKIMPFGDSITDGYNSDTQGGYRIELFHDLHTAGKNITFVGSGSNGPSTVDGVPFPQNHEGHSGWTIAPEGGRSGISTLVSTVMPQFKPDVVLLMIGTNDAIDNYDMANAPTRLGGLIDSIYAQLPNVLIVVAQPIPSRGNASLGDDTMLSARIQTYDGSVPAVVKARADAGKHILTADMFTPFNPNKASLLEDQWHPNVQGYALLGDQWFSAIQSAL